MDVSINQQVRELLNLRRLPARLTMPQTAAVLNCREHDIQVLVAKGLLKPLGHPATGTMKWFAGETVEELRRDVNWLSRATDAIKQNWRERNAAKCNGNFSAGGRRLNSN